LRDFLWRQEERVASSEGWLVGVGAAHCFGRAAACRRGENARKRPQVNCHGIGVMGLLIDVASCPFRFGRVKFQLPGHLRHDFQRASCRWTPYQQLLFRPPNVLATTPGSRPSNKSCFVMSELFFFCFNFKIEEAGSEILRFLMVRCP